MSKFYKNWPEICEIKDQNLQMTIALCQDEETLQKFARGFPEYFRDTETPVLITKQLAERAALLWLVNNTYDANTECLRMTSEREWSSVCNDLNIPYRSPDGSENTLVSESERVPDEIYDQLKDREFSYHPEFWYKKKKHILVDFVFEREDDGIIENGFWPEEKP